MFLAVLLMLAYFFGAVTPEVHAWNMSVNPMSRTTVPGGTVTYAISVFYEAPTDMFLPSVVLLISPPEPQVTVTFTYSNPAPHPPPYSATMTVHVDNLKPPGEYKLYLWANPSGTPFPGPGNIEIDVRLVVAGGGVHINVPHSPLSVNQPVYIEYYTDPGADGMITLMITRPPLLAIFWTKGPEPITGGLLYDVTAPGFDTPGTYHVGATVELSGGGTISGQVTFQVVGAAVFDFTIELSPGSRSVSQGETAHYRVMLTYSDPSYSGTIVNIQATGLGPGMGWDLTQSGDLSISTNSITPPRTYTITLTGSANGVQHQATGTLIVTAGEPSTTATQTTMSPTTVTQTSISLTTITQTTFSATTVIKTSVPPTTQATTSKQTGQVEDFINTIPGGIMTLAGVAAVIILAAAAILLFRRRGAGPPTAAPTPPSAAPAAAPPTPSAQPLSVKYCISCGAQIPRSAKFCPECRANQTE
jgi:hypothetical protein